MFFRPRKNTEQYANIDTMVGLNRFFGLNTLCPSTSYVFKAIVDGKAVIMKKGLSALDSLTQRIRIPTIDENTGKTKLLKISTAYIRCIHRLTVHVPNLPRKSVPLREYIQEARTLIL